MTTLIFGAGGMLGQALTAEGACRDRVTVAVPRQVVDITDREAVLSIVRRERPETIVNCAALTAVDACEERREEAFEVNARSVEHLAAAAASIEASLIQVSTDFVFDGTATEPYAEEASTSALSVYGESKRRGELAALDYERGLVLRTSWLFGPGGPNFVATMAGLLTAGRKPLRVVADQIGCPTYTPFLARAIWDIAGLRNHGILHYRNRDPVSWHGFACEIASLLDDPDEVLAISSEELARPAPRPAYSVLDVARFEGLVDRRVEEWRDGLTEYLTTIRDRGQS